MRNACSFTDIRMSPPCGLMIKSVTSIMDRISGRDIDRPPIIQNMIANGTLRRTVTVLIPAVAFGSTMATAFGSVSLIDDVTVPVLRTLHTSPSSNHPSCNGQRYRQSDLQGEFFDSNRRFKYQKR